MSVSRKKLLLNVPRENLRKYGFFYHEASNCWWYVFSTNINQESNVELSLRVYDDTDEVRLYATNDHLKLPSVFNPKYNKNNYLELEEELDKFSFDEWVSIGVLYELFQDGVIKYVKPQNKPRVKKKYNNVLGTRVLKTLDTPTE